ncbi:SH3 domain-containing protein [Oceanimonas sp. GK1]|uniref:SH3 domain-containing protein n=1 Tax=Oceanimonas sp. (strain GK1 / IBRC-M 10197) TaxID=511062 RepID=UPI000A00DCFD|nr:SH3 domain-containing protein [Oceanimonas sp. GK1]
MNHKNSQFPYANVKKLRVTSIAVLIVSLLGCGATENGSFTGADALGGVIGGVTGALIGSQVGGGSGRILATGAGAIAGAFIGREIARHLSRSGQQQLAQANTRALETGQPQVWRDPETGATGRTEVTQRTTAREQVPVRVKKDRIDQMPPIDLIGSTYIATAGSNVRGGPGTDYRSVGGLSAGQRVHVIGKVQNKNWLLISEDGAANGFVAAQLLQPAPAAQQVSSATAPATTGETVMVDANRTCSLNTTKVTQPDGSVTEDRIRICEGPDGYVIEDA